MNSSNPDLTLVGTTPAQSGVVVAPTPKPRRVFRPSDQTRQYQQLATIWNAADGTVKSGWKNLSQQIVNNGAVNMLSKIGPYATFLQLNTMLQGAGLDFNVVAPSEPEAPFALPAVTLTGSGAGATLVLTLHAASAYAPNVIVYAAKPVLAGNNVYNPKSFKRIGSLGGLTSGANAITALFATKFRVPTPGYEVALQIVGVMDSGFHTNRVLVTGIISG